MLLLEVAANAVTTVSVLLAGRNSVHTWWLGIVGCSLFSVLFFGVQLYADATLQLFYIVTSAIGWWLWRRDDGQPKSDVQVSRGRTLLVAVALAVVAAFGYGALLHFTTDAYRPFTDSIVLTLSITAQVLMMRRRVEAWWFWIVVNAIAAPLFYSRGLTLTAVVYSLWLVNAIVALRHWRALQQRAVHAS